MSGRVRALIVDDEPLARKRIATLLADNPRILVVGESSDGSSAVNDILRLKPDLVFLDIQMPELDGFGVIGAIGADRMPAVIFITAYDDYAVRAFEVNAIDYLLKPYDPDRFAAAVDRALRHISEASPPGGENIDNLLSGLRRDRRLDSRILVREGERITVVKTADIDYIESAGNYVKLHIGKRDHLVRDTMKSLEDRLPSDRFVRVHRTVIVNIERIKELRAHFHGDFDLLLTDGTRLPLSRRYRGRLEEALGRR